MKILVNSDKTIDVDLRLTRLVEAEVSRALARFETKLTRVEVHLSDIDNKKTGQPDKRCLVEARPAGDRPRSASAITTQMETAVSEALGKMQRSLTTFFGRKGRPAVSASAVDETAHKVASTDTALRVNEKAAVPKAAAVKKSTTKKPVKLSPRGPKKKAIYQARRKSPTDR